MAKPDQYRDAAAVAAIEAETNRTGNDYRALVCVFLNGGNDSHNMIIPRAGSANRIHYDVQRGTLAITAGTELPLTTDWGLNPNMPNVKAIFDAGKLGVLTNVGVLAKPTTRAQYKANTVALPSQLYAHNSQQALWQALPYLGQSPKTGYMGRADDLVGEFFNLSASDDINGLFSIAGRPLQMQGFEARSNDLQTSGPTTATASATNVPALYLTPARTRQVWNNKRQAMFANAVKSSVVKQAAISANLQALPAPIATTFTGLLTTNGNLGAQLAMVARILLSRSNFSHRRDCFYVTISGWDDHDGLASNYGPRLGQLDAALSAFWAALGQLGLQNNVTVYTQSDFGRALKQNNDGSDHGWGGHSLIMGGSVQGGQLFGQAPDFATGSDTDADQGRQIPTTSADQYIATMLKWWGVPDGQLETVLPNLVNFPVKTLSIMAEPAPVVAQPKAFTLDLVTEMVNNKKLPATVTHSRPVSSVCSQFDREGNMIPSPVNAIPNSEFVGGEAFLNQTITSFVADWHPTTVASGLGLQHRLVGTGIEDGMRYTEWRLFGTTTGTSYPQIGVTPYASAGNAVVGALGQSWTFFIKAKRMPGALASMPYAANLRGTLANGTGVTGHDISASINMPTEVGKVFQLRVPYHITDATCVRLQARFFLPGVVAGTTVDETVRLYEPMLIPGIWETPPPYLPTTGAALAMPRLDYDPATGRARGVMRDPARNNVLRNSRFGNGWIGMVGAGIPGAAPAAHSVTTTQPGMALVFGVRKTVNNIPVLTLRLFGKATSVANTTMDLDTTAATVVAGANEDWVSSIYARLAAGTFAGLSSAGIQTVGMNTGVYTEEGNGSFLTLTNGRLVAQRVFAPRIMSNVTTNQVKTRLMFAANVGEYVDVTIELGAPQLEKGRYASSWIPTGPSATVNANSGVYAVRAADTVEVAGASFTPWFNPVEGTLVVKGETQLSPAGTQNSFPRLTGFSGGTILDNFGIYGLAGPSLSFHGRSGGSTVINNVTSADTSISTPPVANGKPASRAMSYSAGYLQVSHRGVLSTPSAPAAFPTVNRLTIGYGSSFDAPVWIQSVDYYSTKLTPTEMTVLTSS